MMTVRPAQTRGVTNVGWLNSKHTFSFGYYYDPSQMGVSSLRVINEDIVQPSKGFSTHAHQDMEIISYVLEGELEHKDSVGNCSVIRPGDIQRISAGTGIAHSEFNTSSTDPVHFLQIWVLPEQNGIQPSYEQQHFSLEEKQSELRLIVSSDGRNNSLMIHQDANIYVAVLDSGDRITHHTDPRRSLWLQITRGSVEIKGQILQIGDGAAITEERDLTIKATAQNTEVLLFDLAAIN